MKDINKPILNQLIRSAFPQVGQFSYKITEYSLNAMFSFKFDSLAHFTTFLQEHHTVSEQEHLLLQNTLKDLNLEPNSFFYINFFEEDKPLTS